MDPNPTRADPAPSEATGDGGGKDGGGKDGADKGKGGKSQPAAAAGGGGQSIKRIEAEGNVVLTQPGEIAQGDSGVYDPIADTLVLENNVVLTRGENVVRGSRLDSNLATGVSVVSAPPGKRVESPAAAQHGVRRWHGPGGETLCADRDATLLAQPVAGGSGGPATGLRKVAPDLLLTL